jgi:hypothetical protein
MDEQDRSESKIRQRREMLARRLGEALDQVDPHSAGKCPDADIIAAYSEEALTPAEAAECEGHFAACARCRKILRVLAASADTPLAEKEVAHLGELVSRVSAPVGIDAARARPSRPKHFDWRSSWLAPAVGVAAVLVVWFAMRPPWRATQRSDSGTLIAQAPKEEIPQSPAAPEQDRLSRVAPQRDQKREATSLDDRSSAKTAPLNSSAAVPPNERADAAVDKASPDARAPQDEKRKKSLSEARETASPAAPGQSPAAPPGQPAMAPPVPQSAAKTTTGSKDTEVAQAEANSNAVLNAPSSDKQAGAIQRKANEAPASSAQARVSPSLQANERKEQTFDALGPLRKVSSFLKTPSGSILWRAGRGGKIERSTDAGKTWLPQASPSQEDWLAGAVVSETVCWLAGRHGALARTADGQRWERVSPPAQAAGTDGSLPDWVAITARDAQSATITASDGRKFATADGGKTWQLP